MPYVNDTEDMQKMGSGQEPEERTSGPGTL